jgi:hypothetical protein
LGNQPSIPDITTKDAPHTVMDIQNIMAQYLVEAGSPLPAGRKPIQQGRPDTSALFNKVKA